MAVSTTYEPTTIAGNGVTTAIPITWQFFHSPTVQSLVVTLISSAGVETVKSISTHYTVSGGTDANGLPSTGTVTMLTAPATGEKARVERVTPRTQATTYNHNDAFPPKTHEAALDKLTLINQEILYETTRSIKLKTADMEAGADPELPLMDGNESEALTFNADGDGVDTVSLAGIDLDIGSVTTGAAGSSASASITGTAPDFELNLTIPRGDTGGSGAGTGDVVGPASVTANTYVKWDGTTGDLLKEGATTIPLGDLALTGGTAETAPAVADELAIYDASATANRKMTVANFLKVINQLTAETAPAAGDELAMYDASGSTTDKITLANLFKVITDLTAETAPAVDDEVALYDTSGTATDKITLANLLKVLNELPEDATPDTAADFLLSYDTSSSAVRKVKPANIAVAGANVVQTVGTTNLSTTSTSYVTTAITGAITPSSDSSRVRIKFNGYGGADGINVHFTLYRDAVALTPSGTNEMAAIAGVDGSMVYPVLMEFIDSPATASEVTYSVYWKVSGGTGYLGRRSDAADFDLPNILIVEEVAAA